MKTEPRRWFADLIAQGLMSLHVLSLDARPAADQINYTAQVWIESLWPMKDWDRDLDADRIRAAFARLVVDSVKWPSPKQFRLALPERPPQPRLPAPKLSEEERKAASKRMRAMIDEAFRGEV